jgi:hypothetical protein
MPKMKFYEVNPVLGIGISTFISLDKKFNYLSFFDFILLDIK